MMVGVPCKSILDTCWMISEPNTDAGAAFIWRLPRHCDIEPTGGENSDLADLRRQGLLFFNLG